MIAPATAVESRQPLGATTTARFLLVGVVLVYLLIVLRSAWLCDDAFISFRAAANLTRGSGFSYNPGERVQSFTSPLWTLAFAALYSLVRNAYAVGIGLGVGASMATVWVIATHGPGHRVARMAAIGVLCLSAAYTDYSTSGLENPLSHLLLAAFVSVVFGCVPRASDRALFVLAGLLTLNRMDHLLLVAPVLLSTAWRRGGPWAARSFAIGFAPFGAWVMFAVVYYGFPFPNTAYAKLNLEVPRVAVLRQGLTYLMDSLHQDPVTPAVICLALAGGLVFSDRRYRWLSAGVAAYVVYVVSIGGDFMSGRFLTCPLLVSVLLLASRDLAPSTGVRVGAFGLAAVAVAMAPLSPLRDRDRRCIVPRSGVVDERACYEEHTALRVNIRSAMYRSHPYFESGKKARELGKKVEVHGAAGLTGFAAADKVHIVDAYALTDPLLARIPFHGGNDGWRIGHFRRELPEGYLASLETGENRVTNPHLRGLLDDLWRVTRGPLLSWERFLVIARLNLGSYASA